MRSTGSKNMTRQEQFAIAFGPVPVLSVDRPAYMKWWRARLFAGLPTRLVFIGKVPKNTIGRREYYRLKQREHRAKVKTQLAQVVTAKIEVANNPTLG